MVRRIYQQRFLESIFILSSIIGSGYIANGSLLLGINYVRPSKKNINDERNNSIIRLLPNIWFTES